VVGAVEAQVRRLRAFAFLLVGLVSGGWGRAGRRKDRSVNEKYIENIKSA